MAKLIPLDEAAKYLGITPEELIEMRSRSDISGYRDGTSWKFKQEELDRVRDRMSGMGSAIGDEMTLEEDDVDLPVDLGAELGMELDDAPIEDAELLADDQPTEEGDSILVTDDLGVEVERSTSSTVIGKEDHGQSSEDSDLKLAPADDDHVGADAGEMTLVGESGLDLRLEPADQARDQDIVDDSGLSLVTADDEGEDDLLLSGGSDPSPVASSDLELDDDEIVLDDIDVTLSGDSGVNLTSPSDSGISLESLDDEELGASDDLVSLDEDAVGAGRDDAFDLTPNEDLSAEEDDSSSQVIALDPDQFVGDFEEDAAVAAEAEGLIEEEAIDFGEESEAAAVGAAPAVATRGADDGMDLTGGNIVALSSLATLMLLSGIILVDVIRNIWSWSGQGFSGTLVSALSGLLN